MAYAKYVGDSMEKILEFIELQDTISYNQSFELALKCSRLIVNGTENDLVMADKIKAFLK